ncbi:MAG: DegT/DnrJ/EryC1/StrS aminotransferase, partial [Parcubacteria group bacterium GW2011_GWB1_57_6]
KSFIAKRRIAAKRYDKLLKDLQGVTLPPRDTATVQSAWHLYPVRVDAKKHRKVFDYLRGKGIGVQVHHIPVHTHPYYGKLGYKKGSCPNAERLYDSAVSVPLFATITVAQQLRVVRTLKQALA